MYTHYWNRYELTIPKARWSDYISDIEKAMLILQKDIVIASADGEAVNPECSADNIAFNGYKDGSLETFWIPRTITFKGNEHSEWLMYQRDIWKKDKCLSGYCKTGRKPYDLAVCVVLILTKHHFPYMMDISSDGIDSETFEMDEEWIPAFDFIGEHFPDCTITSAKELLANHELHALVNKIVKENENDATGG